ncbi:MAG: glycosyl transferase [Clostridia bacterium]|nr:glycosyl transferase [Clostridia bacterium]
MKFAYLIIAHTEPDMLKALLRCLDDERNDIFLHIDAKSPMQYEDFQAILRRSKLTVMPRMDIQWGGFSLIQLEMDFLDMALKQGPYDYFHLLSGQDLPIKTQDEIHAFFEAHNGTEFVSIEEGKTKSPSVQWRYRYYHWLKEFYGRKKGLLGRAEDALIFLQKPFVRRDRNCVYGGGHQWFSITGAFAEYAAAHRAWINKRFHFTYCCDEIFLQTLLLQSPFREKLNRASDMPGCLQCARLIDWVRGGPYTFTIDDLDMILASPAMFARKLSMANSPCRKLTEALEARITQ